MDGVINLYKHRDITSHKATQQVKEILKAKKAGHTGTLDPFAEGVLLVCLNRATRIAEYLSVLDKEYEAVIRFGVTTDTYDYTGEILREEDPSGLTEERVSEVIHSFRGVYNQEPPMYSAKKMKGTPLYKLARKGIQVQRSTEKVNIHSIVLTDWQPPEATIRIVCSKGTYIRSVVHDIGTRLGVGAIVKELKRLAVGRFRINDSVGLDALSRGDFYLYSIDEALSHLPEIVLNEREYRLAIHGTGFRIDTYFPEGTLLRLKSPAGEFIGIAKINKENFLRIDKIIV